MLRKILYVTLFFGLGGNSIGLQEMFDYASKQFIQEQTYRQTVVSHHSSLRFSSFAYAKPLNPDLKLSKQLEKPLNFTENYLQTKAKLSYEAYAFMKEEAILEVMNLTQAPLEMRFEDKPANVAVYASDLPTSWTLEPIARQTLENTTNTLFEPLFGYNRSMVYDDSADDLPTQAGIMILGSSNIAKTSLGFGASGIGDETAIAGKLSTPTLSLVKPEVTTKGASLPHSGTSPALDLALNDGNYARSEKCLSDAVFWEARSEPEKGQMAVAQVVVNRALSGYYPNDVCKVVYQNAHRYMGCQFSFACEGKKLIVNEPEEWSRAKKIAKDMLAGKIWLDDVGNATHYHASYVSPYWAKSMQKKQKIGLHSFFRPREWN